MLTSNKNYNKTNSSEKNKKEYTLNENDTLNFNNKSNENENENDDNGDNSNLDKELNKGCIPKLDSEFPSERHMELITNSNEVFILTLGIIKDDGDSEGRILMRAENKNVIERFTYNKLLSFEDFKELGRLFSPYKDIEEIFKFISDAYKKGNFMIKEVKNKEYLTLYIEGEISGIKEEELKAEISLEKKDRDPNDLINILYNALNEFKSREKELESENEELKLKNQKLESKETPN
eukprot:jgi/Orpsp1_1/1190402/evm.model.d7180000078759.1